MRLWASVIAGVVFLSGCGEGAPAQPVVGDEPITYQAIAAVASERLDEEPHDIQRWDVLTRELGPPSPGVQMRAGRDFTINTALTPTPVNERRWPLCGWDLWDGCERVELGGRTVIVAWQEYEPEEDPGEVSVMDLRHDELVVVNWTGYGITGDPRKQDIGISLEVLAAVATDPRLSLTTSPEVIDLGDGIKVPAGPAGESAGETPGE